MDLQGNWFKAGSSASTPAQLVLENHETLVGEIQTDAGETTKVEIRSISDRIGSVSRRLELEDGHAFVTSDNDTVDKLSGLSGGIFSNVARFESFHPRLIAFLLMAVGLFYAIIVYGVPLTAKVAAWSTPQQVVSWMDSSTTTTLDKIFFGDSTLEQARRDGLKIKFKKLAELSEYKGRLELHFRNGGRMGANALALPDGTIIVTDELAILGTDNEILAVLAHEISHVQNDHSLQQLYRALGFAGIVSLITGDLGTVAEEILSGGGVLVAMAASREMELEADAKAVNIMKKADINPNDLSSILDKLYKSACKGVEQVCEETGWFSSHPGGDERRRALKNIINN